MSVPMLIAGAAPATPILSKPTSFAMTPGAHPAPITLSINTSRVTSLRKLRGRGSSATDPSVKALQREQRVQFELVLRRPVLVVEEVEEADTAHVDLVTHVKCHFVAQVPSELC